MGKRLCISRKCLQPAKYLPQLPIWYQYPLRVLGAALGDATTQLLPAVAGEGRGTVQVNFSTYSATPLLGPRATAATSPRVVAGKRAEGLPEPRAGEERRSWEKRGCINH